MTKPDKDRVKDIIWNWCYWSWDMPPDPAQVYYYTECPALSGNMTEQEARELGLTIKGPKDRNDLFNPPAPAPVTLLTAEEYAHVRGL